MHNTVPSANQLLLTLAVIIFCVALVKIVRKIGMPNVAGELLLGMVLAICAHKHIWIWHEIISNKTIELFAEIGSVLLLFEIGLESKISDLLVVGRHGITVAIIGVAIPLFLGAILIGQLLLASDNLKFNLFLGATLAATSTGISVRAFKDLKIINTVACQIVLAASVIDDVLALIILAIVSGLVATSNFNFSSIATILFHVTVFFTITLFIARRFSPKLVKLVLKISSEESTVVALLLSICLFCAWLAGQLGLASIVGAFVAGLIIDELWFSEKGKNAHNESYLADLIKPINYAFVPIFFVYAGMQVDLLAIANWHILIYGIAISIVAIFGKLISGIFLPKYINKLVVGFGMVPRGEVGLIFALTGVEMGVFNHDIFAAILIMIIVTSLIAPIALYRLK